MLSQVEDVVKLQGTMPMYFNGAKISDKLYKMLRDHQAAVMSLDSGRLHACLQAPRSDDEC